MKIIKDWMYAISACKKYGIKWNPWFGLKHAQASFCYGRRKNIIAINPFYPNFKQTFLHELSHILSFTRMDNKGIDLDLHLADFHKKMVEETKAWVFGKRIMKGDFDSSVAKSCLQSYTRNHYAIVCSDEVTSYTDTVYKCLSKFD